MLESNILLDLLGDQEGASKLVAKCKDKILNIDELKALGFEASSIDGMLRNNFWNEINNARIYRLKNLDLSSVYLGICTHQQFLEKLDNDKFCNYILNPILDHDQGLSTTLTAYGNDVYKKILEHDFTGYKKVGEEEDGSPIYRKVPLTATEEIQMMKLKVDVIKRLEDRTKGKPLERYQGYIKGNVGLVDSRRAAFLDQMKGLGLNEIKARIAEMDDDGVLGAIDYINNDKKGV